MKNKKEKIIIEDAKLGDESGVVFVLKKTWLATYPNKKYNIFKKDILLKDFNSKEKVYKWRKIIKNNGKKNEYLCVAKIGDKLVGICLSLKKNKKKEIGAIYVLPNYQKAGIGCKLMEKAMSWLGKKGRITILVAKYNKKAISFYKKYGFVELPDKNLYKKLPNKKRIPEIKLETVF